MKGRLFVLMLGSLLLLAACGEEKPTQARLESTDTQVSVSGEGTIGSPAFTIKLDGSYVAYWKASKQKGGENDPVGCPMKAQIVSAEKEVGFFRTITNDSAPSTGKPGMMTTKPYRLQAQKYAFDVTTDCSWQIVMERQLRK